MLKGLVKNERNENEKKMTLPKVRDENVKTPVELVLKFMTLLCINKTSEFSIVVMMTRMMMVLLMVMLSERSVLLSDTLQLMCKSKTRAVLCGGFFTLGCCIYTYHRLSF